MLKFLDNGLVSGYTYSIMISDDLIDEIEAVEKDLETVSDVKDTSRTFLVFNMNTETYAIQASLTREIMRDLAVYPLPFVPSYVNGVLNRHGDPFTVIDPMIILGKEPQVNSLFLVLNIENEQLCLRISDVVEFMPVKTEEIKKFSNHISVIHFDGTISWKDKEIPIINTRSFIDKLRLDLKNA